MSYFNVHNAGLEQLNAEFQKSVVDMGDIIVDLNRSLAAIPDAVWGGPLPIWQENQNTWNREYQLMVDDIQEKAGKSVMVHNIFLEGDRAGQRIMSGG